ncbi:MAG: hypothetical protein AB1847_06740 [bacterium]
MIYKLLRCLNYGAAIWYIIDGVLLIFPFPGVLPFLNPQPSVDLGLFRLTGILLVFIGIGYAWTSLNAAATTWYMWIMGVIFNGMVFLVETYTVLFRNVACFYVIQGLASGLFCWAFLSLLTVLHYSRKIETIV